MSGGAVEGVGMTGRRRNEPEKGRVDIQLISEDRIKPIETVEAGEVELADEA